MKVFLLGAGASKSYNDSPTGETMPVALDFFQTFNKLTISENPWVLIGALYGYLLEKGITDPYSYLDAGVDIEALYSEIEKELKIVANSSDDTLANMQARRAYTQLTFIFASTINEIQNGSPSQAHRKIAQTLTADDAVITFNWDTLMDRALSIETEWCVDWGYGSIPDGIYSNGWRAPEPKASTGKAPRLIKLHGSTNWITAYTIMDEGGNAKLTHELDPSTLHVFEFSNEEYPCFQGRYMDGYEPFSFGYYPPNLQNIPSLAAPDGYVLFQAGLNAAFMQKGEASKEGLTSMPLIIPPVRNKTYDLFGGLFKDLWLEAEQILTLADEIIIIGYSFPKTDSQSHELFKKAFSKKSSLPKITIIDPNPNRIEDKFRFDFGIPSSHLKVITDYFSEKFDLSSL